jgi:hypothetical protein
MYFLHTVVYENKELAKMVSISTIGARKKTVGGRKWLEAPPLSFKSVSNEHAPTLD